MRTVERRRSVASRLRVYFDAIKDAEATSNDEWLRRWVEHCDSETLFIPRRVWLDILRTWALAEASRIVQKSTSFKNRGIILK